MSIRSRHRVMAATSAAVAAISMTLLPSTAAASPPPSMMVATELPYGPDTCKQGYVWREAIPSDHVCVTPATRSQTAHDNSQAAVRRNPTGPYGSNTCIQGYVWREAFNGDVVCVTPEIRTQTKTDNSLAASRVEQRDEPKQAPAPPAPPPSKPVRAVGRPSPLTVTYACADDNAGEVLPGDTITCKLSLTATRDVPLAVADLYLPDSTIYLSGAGSPESAVPRFDGKTAQFRILSLNAGGSRIVSMKVQVKKATPDETVLVPKVEYKVASDDKPRTEYGAPLTTSLAPAKPDGKSGQPRGPDTHSPDNRHPKAQLKAIEGLSFSIPPGGTQDVNASSLAVRTGGNPKNLRLWGNCTGEKHGTVTVRNKNQTATYQNNGTAGEEKLTCEIFDNDAHNTPRVRSQVMIKVG